MKTILILSAALIISANQSFAAAVNGSSNVKIVSAITIVPSLSLEFGSVVTSATAGTVIINASTGGVTVTGGATTLSSTSRRAGTFNVTGEANATYSINLPTSVTLANSANNITVSTFTSSPSPTTTGTLSASGAQTLLVGATLNVAANQALGTYTGTYSVTVNYN